MAKRAAAAAAAGSTSTDCPDGSTLDPTTGTCGPIRVTGGTGQTGFPPQSLVPLGTFIEGPGAPPASPGSPASPGTVTASPVAVAAAAPLDLAQWRRWVSSVLLALDGPAAATAPEVKALGASIQDRDARLAAKNPPRRVTVAIAPEK